LANKTGPYGNLGSNLNTFIYFVFGFIITGFVVAIGAGGGIDIIGALIPGITGWNIMLAFP